MGGFLKGKKTYIAAGITALTAVAGYLTGDLSMTDAAQLVVTAIMGVTIRNGVKNDTKTISQ